MVVNFLRTIDLKLKNEVSRAVEHLMAGDIKEFKSNNSS